MSAIRTFVCNAAFAATSLMAIASSAGAQVVQGSGTLSARFITPTPVCQPTGVAADYMPTCDGENTNMIRWGQPGTFGRGQSSFMFTPVGNGIFEDIPLGRTFVLGTLTFYNGTIFIGSEISEVVLEITSVSSTSAFNQILGLPLRIVQTPNQNIDPLADADFLFFADATQFGSFRVLEGQSAAVEILGQFN